MECINTWLYGKASTTIKVYRSDILLFIDYVNSQNLSLNQVRLVHLQVWLKLYNKHGTRRKIIVLKSFFKHAYQNDYVSHNVAKSLRVPRALPARRERILSREQVEESFGNVQGRRKQFVQLLFYLGLRVSECARLHKNDFKQTGSIIEVSIMGKGSKERTVYLPKRLFQLYKNLPGGYLFQGKKGHICSRTAQKWAKNAFKGISKHASCHWYRHCYCSFLLQNNTIPIVEISKSMGHSNLATTSLYAHAIGSVISDVIMRISSYFCRYANRMDLTW